MSQPSRVISVDIAADCADVCCHACCTCCSQGMGSALSSGAALPVLHVVASVTLASLMGGFNTQTFLDLSMRCATLLHTTTHWMHSNAAYSPRLVCRAASVSMAVICRCPSSAGLGGPWDMSTLCISSSIPKTTYTEHPHAAQSSTLCICDVLPQVQSGADSVRRLLTLPLRHQQQLQHTAAGNSARLRQLQSYWC
jgi:hypothetical protein